MYLVGVKLDSTTFASILCSCDKIEALEQGMDIHQNIMKVGLCQILWLEMLPSCDNMRSLEIRYEHPSKHNEGGFVSNNMVWNAFVDMFGKCGSIDIALALFDRMPRSHRMLLMWEL